MGKRIKLFNSEKATQMYSGNIITSETADAEVFPFSLFKLLNMQWGIDSCFGDMNYTLERQRRGRLLKEFLRLVWYLRILVDLRTDYILRCDNYAIGPTLSAGRVFPRGVPAQRR